ncbi:membrane protein [Pullulanibacillus camelliae]|uniref:Membrane protein n=1 Tax=Pullulanibacillus camelliae TaxID=1707096 RepID=A0A8J3E0Z9_9BACL|nr:multidrug resistance efflux transporter family protein [Pullulanibacillus camelliae]GGE55480.1 membrane protein [Pullulanibacillus camelliae]
MKEILIGLSSALFFSVTFILNRSMGLDGGSWIWSASLRFFFMLPILFIIVGCQKRIGPVFIHIKKQPVAWCVWSTVGFGLFYAPLTFASSYGPGWLVAATFQLTIIAGSLLVPFINAKAGDNPTIPLSSIGISSIILIGIFCMQLEHAFSVPVTDVVLCVLPLVLSAFAYPLGNRKMIQLVNGDLNTFQRMLGMTIASLPFWVVLSIYGALKDGMPSTQQLGQTFIVALSSGIIATVLFFYATEQVKHDNHKLAAVEATQSGEVVFALLGELLLLHAPLPKLLSFIGMALVIIGMVVHSSSTRTQVKPAKHSSQSHY